MTMKIKFQKGYVAIYSKGLLKLIGIKNAKAFAIFPIMGFKDESFETQRIINHEKIHFRQQIELLFIGEILCRLIERLYLRLFLSKNSLDSYKLCCFEQEAYLNQDNDNYLKDRKLFSFIKYIRNKTNFEFDASEPAKIFIK